MLNIQRIFTEYQKADTVEKLSSIPGIGSITNLGFVVVKAMNDLKMVRFSSDNMTILNKHNYVELCITALPIVGTIYRIHQFITRSLLADKLALELAKAQAEAAQKEQARAVINRFTHSCIALYKEHKTQVAPVAVPSLPTVSLAPKAEAGIIAGTLVAITTFIGLGSWLKQPTVEAMRTQAEPPFLFSNNTVDLTFLFKPLN